jgi:hypothetical protein
LNEIKQIPKKQKVTSRTSGRKNAPENHTGTVSFFARNRSILNAHPPAD